MANPLRGQIRITIEGEPFTLSLTLACLARLEHDLGTTSLSQLTRLLLAGPHTADLMAKVVSLALDGGRDLQPVKQLQAQGRLPGIYTQLMLASFGA